MADAFVKRGVPRASVQEAGDMSRAHILEAISKAGGGLKPGDLLWLVILGHAEMHDDGPVLSVKGERLSPADLADALSKVPARQYVVVTTESSGAFIPFLKAANRVILTATEPSNEINETVFPDAFAQALQDKTSVTFLDLAKTTAALVSKNYELQQKVQTEHAMLCDPKCPDLMEAPFDKKTGPLLAEEKPQERSTFFDDQSVEPTPEPEVKQVAGTLPANRQPATPETLALVKASLPAHAVDSDYPVVIVSRDRSILVNRDLKQTESTHEVALVNKTQAVHRGDFEVQIAGLEEMEVKIDRVIFPDGTFLNARNENVMNGEDGPTSETVISLRLPMVTPGCLIETSVVHQRMPDPTFSGLYQEFTLTDDVPILHSTLELRLPKEGTVLYRIRNLPGEPVQEASEYSQVYRWTWENVAAVEPLPLDPPVRDVQGELLLSSFKTWKDFAEWYGRISVGADEAGDLVKSRARQVTAGLESDHDKLQALFEEVSRIHYTAIEIGVGGFRPHTPEWVLQHNYGDCKDKANLLLALAKQAGISGKFVLLNRASATDRQFPGQQFNHALAFFPSVDNGIWLDATDEITPYGQLPPGDVGRDGLLMGTEPVFQQIPTPPAQATQLIEHMTVDVSGKQPGQWIIDAKGLADYEMRGVLRNTSARATDLYLRTLLEAEVPGATLESHTVSDVEKLSVPLHIDCHFSSLPGACVAWSRQMRLPMDLLEAVATPERKLPLLLNDGQPFETETTLDFVGMKPETLPKDLTLEVTGATAQVHFLQVGDTFTRKIVINVTQPSISPTDYPAFRSLVRQVLSSIMNTPTTPAYAN